MKQFSNTDSEFSGKHYAMFKKGLLLSSILILLAFFMPTSVCAANEGNKTPIQQTVTTTEANIKQFNSSLAAALASIGATPATLQIDTGINLPASVTVPATLTLRFTNSGQINIAEGQTLTMLGTLDARQFPIFTGNGEVQFTGKYPPAFYPEWWGAVGNGTTDDHQAFSRMLAAMKAGSEAGALPGGGRIELQGGKSYYLASTLEIQRNIHLTTAAGWGSSALKFAPDKTGLILHSLSSKTGAYVVANGRALNSVIENIALIAVPTVTTPTTVTVSGNKVTWTAGTKFDVTAPVQDGNTIYINGHDYQLEGIANPTSIILKSNWPVLLDAAGGTNIVTNIGYQNITPDWVGAILQLGGVNYTITAVTPLNNLYGYGATMTLSGTPAPFRGTGKISSGFSRTLTNLPARMNIYHGIDLRATVVLRNITINYFHGNGVNANSTQTPSFNLGAEPNTNNVKLERVWTEFNSGNGIYMKGVNANNGVIENCSATNNHGFGIFENSFLGNNYIGNHLSSNYLGGYYSTQGGNNVSTFFGNYAEGDQPPNAFGNLTHMAGGNYANGIDTSVESPRVVGVSNASDSYLTHGGLSRGNIGEPVKLLTHADNTGMASNAFSYYLADTSGGGLNYNLPPPFAENLGRVYTFKKTDGAAAFTLYATGGATIDGAGTLTVGSTAVRLIYYNTNKWATL